MDDMAWIIAHREFNWQRPGSRFSFNVKPSATPQSRVRDFVDAAIAAGAATRWHATAATAPPKRTRHKA